MRTIVYLNSHKHKYKAYSLIHSTYSKELIIHLLYLVRQYLHYIVEHHRLIILPDG